MHARSRDGRAGVRGRPLVNTPTLYFAATGGLTAPAQRWLRPVLGAWPSMAPEWRAMLADELVEFLDPAGRGAGHDAIPGAVLAVVGPGVRPSVVDRLLEALSTRCAPAVILVEKPEDWALFQRHGVIFLAHDAGAEMIASMLYALMERQPAVRLLAHEIDLALRCQGGIRNEMDRLHEELHLAAALQRDFTSSPLPRVPGLDINVLFRPVNFVSGDVYSVREVGPSRVAFFVADAVGHGVPAALLTMVLTSSLMAAAASSAASEPHSPAHVLARLNERLCASCLGTGRFATAVYGVIDAETRKVTVAGAGHPLPILLSGGESSEIETAGPLLGVFNDAEFDQREIALADDDMLMLYTDGLDAAFPLEASGAQRAVLKRDRWIADLARGAAGARRGATSGLLSELQHRLDVQAGSMHGGDDVTALCITACAA